MNLSNLRIDTGEVEKSLPDLSEVVEINRGGFKIVYSAKIKSKKEALKLVIIPSVPAGQEQLRTECLGRVKREINVLANCKRTEIVKLGSLAPTAIVIGGNTFIAYSEEFLEGRTLFEIVSDQKASGPDWLELKVLTISLLKAIQELWAQKIIHRDIKPSNVIKTGDPRRPFVLLDLGIAFSIIETHLTVAPEQRHPVGTWRYMAPEMLRPNFRDTVSFRSDLYTMGQTVFEYAARVHPLARNSDDLFQTVTRIVTQEPRQLSELRTDLPKAFCNLIDQTMKKIPALRPGNIEHLIQTVEGL